MRDWDRWFLGLADYVGTASKDPSTKVGAVIVRPNRTIASVGYNGFPRGVGDWPARLQDRGEKYPRTVHAELNAILNAEGPVRGCILYVNPLFPCAQCAAAIIQAGITEVVYPKEESLLERWKFEQEVALSMFSEAKVVLREVRLGES